MGTNRATSLISALAAVLTPALEFAWGEDGHSNVAEIAQHRLSPAGASTAEALLRGEYPPDMPGTVSLASVSSWADDYRDAHRETTNWHFVDIPISVPGVAAADMRYAPVRDCPPASDPSETCVVEALKSEIAILSRAPAAGEAAGTAERLMALKFVVHFMGDLAQPLHCADRDGDGGGNGLHGFYSGPQLPPGEARTNFHHVWDSDMLTDSHWDRDDNVVHLEEDWLPGKDETILASGDSSPGRTNATRRPSWPMASFPST